jgi:DNA-binding MarR family transcriptional regulator
MESQDGPLGVVAALVRSTFLVNAVYTETAREFGLTQQQGQLLCVLLPRPHGMTELGAVLGLAKSSLTGLVDRTARNGLVRREPDPRDTRAVRVVLTQRGSRLARTFYAEVCRRIGELTEGLGEETHEALREVLERVISENKVPAVFPELDVRDTN